MWRRDDLRGGPEEATPDVPRWCTHSFRLKRNLWAPSELPRRTGMRGSASKKLSEKTSSDLSMGKGKLSITKGLLCPSSSNACLRPPRPLAPSPAQSSRPSPSPASGVSDSLKLRGEGQGVCAQEMRFYFLLSPCLLSLIIQPAKGTGARKGAFPPPPRPYRPLSQSCSQQVRVVPCSGLAGRALAPTVKCKQWCILPSWES